MRRKNFRTNILCVCLCFILLFAICPKAQAEAGISPFEEMPIIYTSSIDNLQYPGTNQFITLTGATGAGKVVIQSPTIIKAYMNWNSSEVSSVAIWFSRDMKGIDLVGAQATLSSAKNYQMILLDAGTYYLNYSLKANTGSSTASINIFTTVGVCLVGQYAESTESVYDSSKDFPNLIKFDKMETGFLSITAPIDYYRFELKEKSIVTINFNFKDFKDINLYGATCTLKNSMDANIVEQAYNSQGAEYNMIRKVLDPGVYYITMKGTTTVTSLIVKNTSYVVSATKSTEMYTRGNVKIALKVPFDYTEILATKGNIPKSKLTDYYIWSTYYTEATKSLSDQTYTVTENGTYTFRIYDFLGNYTLYPVKVTNIDKTAPSVLGVADGKVYKTARTIKFQDNLSGVKTAKLNNKGINSGIKISAKGSYTLVLADQVGNKKTIKFKIK